MGLPLHPARGTTGYILLRPAPTSLTSGGTMDFTVVSVQLQESTLVHAAGATVRRSWRPPHPNLRPEYSREGRANGQFVAGGVPDPYSSDARKQPFLKGSLSLTLAPCHRAARLPAPGPLFCCHFVRRLAAFAGSVVTPLTGPLLPVNVKNSRANLHID